MFVPCRWKPAAPRTLSPAGNSSRPPYPVAAPGFCRRPHAGTASQTSGPLPGAAGTGRIHRAVTPWAWRWAPCPASGPAPGWSRSRSEGWGSAGAGGGRWGEPAVELGEAEAAAGAPPTGTAWTSGSRCRRSVPDWAAGAPRSESRCWRWWCFRVAAASPWRTSWTLRSYERPLQPGGDRRRSSEGGYGGTTDPGGAAGVTASVRKREFTGAIIRLNKTIPSVQQRTESHEEKMLNKNFLL